jgi:RNA polymerase sigma-70 factor (ECF subfamily)
MPTPVVALNRAIAIAETEGAESALDLISNVAADLDNYHLMHAARGTYLMQLGRREMAKAAFERALDIAETDAERRFLAGQVAVLTEDIPSSTPRR